MAAKIRSAAVSDNFNVSARFQRQGVAGDSGRAAMGVFVRFKPASSRKCFSTSGC